MTKAPIAPRLSPLNLHTLASGTESELHDRGSYEALRFDGCDLEGFNLAGSTFELCEFLRCNAHNTDIRYARCIETRFELLSAPMLSARSTTWRNCEVHSSRLGVVEMFDAEISELAIEGSKLGLLNLHSSTISDLSIRDCHIEELVLDNAALTRVSFSGVTVDKLSLRGATSRDVDLRGLDFAGIEGIESLKGVTVSSLQATEMAHLFARHLGISVLG